MSGKCPFCKLPIVGDMEEHLVVCSIRDADRVASEAIEELDGAFSAIFRMKQFEEAYEQAELHERLLMMVCKECFRYGFMPVPAIGECPTCAGVIMPAAEYFVESEKA